MKTLKRLLAAGAGLAVLAGQPAAACATCFGASDSAMAQGMNAGIFVMLGFVLLFWVGFGSFFVFIVRRARQVGEPLPGDQQDPQHN